jgi:hypothetical protein
MMVKIGVIFLPFSNPTCHFRDTGDFTGYPSKDLLWDKSAVSLKRHVGFENGTLQIYPL